MSETYPGTMASFHLRAFCPFGCLRVDIVTRANLAVSIQEENKSLSQPLYKKTESFLFAVLSAINAVFFKKKIILKRSISNILPSF